MSQQIQDIYKSMEKHLSDEPKAMPASTGLVSQREAPSADTMTVVNYVKQIRKMRGDFNAK